MFFYIFFEEDPVPLQGISISSNMCGQEPRWLAAMRSRALSAPIHALLARCDVVTRE